MTTLSRTFLIKAVMAAMLTTANAGRHDGKEDNPAAKGVPFSLPKTLLND
jgi:hypothetical protein